MEVEMIKHFSILFFWAATFALFGCAMTSSGNFVGEAGALKFSSEEKEYHFVEAGWMYGEAENYGRPYHSDGNIDGGSWNFRWNLLSLNYSLFRQKGGLFLSVPVSVPMDVGIRPSLVQWVGPFYAGAGVSFIGGLYPSQSDDSTWGRFEGFILYSFGGGFLIDAGSVFSIGAYGTWERVAFNANGSWYDEFLEELFQEEHPDASVAYRKMVATFGIQAFWKFKVPFGIYAEFTPPTLPANDGVAKAKLGAILFY